MLFRILISFTFILVFFAGCSSRNYTYLHSYAPSSSRSLSNGKIKDSKSMHRATMRPYTVLGKTYYPTQVSLNDTFSGIASWYGPNFHNKKTSNGEYYNMYDMTAAHKVLPMNTMVKVTNLENGKQVIVRVNDRGPFVKGRIIDLSNAAAHRMSMVKKGTAPVRLEVIGFNGVIGTQSQYDKSIVVNNYMVQIGAFRNKSGAYLYSKRYNRVENRYTSIVIGGINNGLTLYRVYLKGFKSENEARDFIARGKFKGSFIISE